MLQKEIYLIETAKIRNAALHLKGNKTLVELNAADKVDVWIKQRLSKAKKEVLKNLEVEII